MSWTTSYPKPRHSAFFSDTNGRARPAQLLQDREAVNVRQHDIEQHEVDGRLDRGVQRRAPARALDHPVAGEAERIHEAAANGRVILDNQDC